MITDYPEVFEMCEKLLGESREVRSNPFLKSQ